MESQTSLDFDVSKWQDPVGFLRGESFLQLKKHRPLSTNPEKGMYLGETSISILSRDPDLSRKPPETQGKRIRFLERTMVETNGTGIKP